MRQLAAAFLFAALFLSGIGLVLLDDGTASLPTASAGAQDVGPADAKPHRSGAPRLMEPIAPRRPAQEGDAACDVATIEVVREDGSPLTEAAVLLDGHRVGEGGRADVEARPGVLARLVVIGRMFSRFHADMTLEAGRHVVTVPTGARVAGRISVNGRIPVEPIRLFLTGEDFPCSRETATDHGRFEFFNLSADWTGSLILPYDVELAGDPPAGDEVVVDRQDEHNYLAWRVPIVTPPGGRDFRAPSGWRIALAQPDAALDLDLVEATGIKGRLLRRGDDAFVGRGEAHCVTTDSGATVDFQADPGSGKFAVRIPHDARMVFVEMSDQHRLGWRSLALEGPFEGMRDLGDIELPPLREVAVRVVDEDAKPLPGVTALAGNTCSNGLPTDADGRTTVTIDEQVEAIVVGKLGYQATSVPVPDGGSGSIEVVLHPGPVLSISVRLPDGSVPTSGVYVNLSSRDEMFDEDLETGPALQPVYRQSGASPETKLGCFEPGDQHCVGYAVERDGTVTVAGLKSGAGITVSLRALGFGDALDESFIVVGRAGTHSIVLRAPMMPETFVGVVRTKRGEPVVGADVSLGDDGSDGYGVTVQTDAEGRFSITGVFAALVRVGVSKEGFADLEVLHVPVSVPHDFALAPSEAVAPHVAAESRPQ